MPAPLPRRSEPQQRRDLKIRCSVVSLWFASFDSSLEKKTLQFKWGTGACSQNILPYRLHLMRACIQRVTQAQVVVDGEITGQIDAGLLVLLGVAEPDTNDQLTWLADKIMNLRIFPDDEGKMNRSLVDTGGSMLVVSQFTLYGDCRKGRRPSFIAAAQPEKAEEMYNDFVDHVAGQGVTVATGRFRADMQVTLTNDGPVTLWIDTEEK